MYVLSEYNGHINDGVGSSACVSKEYNGDMNDGVGSSACVSNEYNSNMNDGVTVMNERLGLLLKAATIALESYCSISQYV
ncbi:hypothetical protein CHS0354_031904 [Potamilus streckersoni]|uniref:Uncharacterized protein n=1 Tax=Potamilus streckersoni TaxID=2493646 RepID=A0AAE0RXS7_9BIVA|nr:hypothetical protein CHS0354_031904 [Potamilus streckersoni]